MKAILAILTCAALALIASPRAHAQSESFKAFKQKFAGQDNAHSFSVSGSVVRAVLALAGEREAKRAVRDVHKVRLAVVPATAFQQQGVTVNGFKRFMRKDQFDELMTFRENGDEVSVFNNSPSHPDDQLYMMLIEGKDEVVLIEISGSIDEDYVRSLVGLHHREKDSI